MPESARPDVPGRFIRAVFVASKLRSEEGMYYDGDEWEQAKVHLLLELDLRLQDAAHVQKLKLCVVKDLEGVPQDMISVSTLHLKSDEMVIGLRLNEVPSQEQGSSLYYNVQVLLKSGTDVWAEPLSRELFHLRFPFPGREITWQSVQAPRAEVVALRAFRGCERHHVTGLLYRSGCSIETATGKVAMFWIDLWLLTCALYYFDVVTDLQQLMLFLAEGQYWYLAISCVGLAIPVVSTMVESVQWSEDPPPRAQCDMLRRWAPSMAAKLFAWSEGDAPRPQRDMLRHLVPSMPARLVLIVASVLTQLHILLLVVVSTCMRAKHDLLQGAKQAEVAEAAISAALQSNYWCLIVVGIESVPEASFRSLTISLLVSCASLAFGFASRDKVDAKILHIPGKLNWGPIFAALLVVRALDVTSRLLAINMLHLATRAVPIGGPVAVALLVAAARHCFPEATTSQVLAAAIAHPGQILLGDHSRLPLRVSLWMQVVLQLLAVSLQGLLHVSNWSPEAKAVPWPLLAASVAASITAILGLCVLASLGNKMKHPLLEQLAKDQALTCTALAAALDLPKLTIPVLAAAEEITLDPEAIENEELLRKLEGARTKVHIPATSMRKLGEHFEQHEEQILRLNVIDADFDSDRKLRMLRKLRWDQCCWWHLRVVRFTCACPCAALAMLSCCTELEEVTLDYVQKQTRYWQQLRTASWPQLRVANICSCFREERCYESDTESDSCEKLHESPSKSDESDTESDSCEKLHESPSKSAAVLLEVLVKCKKLEVIDFSGNDYPKGAAWDELFAKKPWPDLDWDRCDFGECKPSPHFRPPQKPPKCSHMSLGVEAAAESEPWQMPPKYLTHVLLRDFREPYRATLLAQLGKCQDIELIQVSFCEDVPSSEWELLRHASWPQLRVADFYSAFSQGSGSGAVLQLLAGSRHLEQLSLSSCMILAEAWKALENAHCPNLWKVDFSNSFMGEEGCATVAMKFLARCSQLVWIDLRGWDAMSWEDLESLGAASWPELRKAVFCTSGNDFHQQAEYLLVKEMEDMYDQEGDARFRLEDRFQELVKELEATFAQRAVFVLQMLSRCPKLTCLDMAGCMVEEGHLSKLPAGCWPELKAFCSEASFEKELERLRRPEPQDAVSILGETASITADEVTAKKPKKKAHKKIAVKPISRADDAAAAAAAQERAASSSAEAHEVEQPAEPGNLLEAPESTERKQPKRKKRYRLVKRTGASARREQTPA